MTQPTPSHDPFDTELERVVRRLQALPVPWADGVAPAVLDVVQTLADAHADAARVPRRVMDLDERSLAPALRAVAFDARRAGVDVEALAPALAQVRRTL